MNVRPGATTGPAAVVVSTPGLIVAGHGALVGGAAHADAAYFGVKLIRLSNILKATSTSKSQPSTPKQGDNHHISTDKHKTYWTPKFKKIFDKAKLDISKAKENIVRVLDHQGPHPDEYHKYVYDKLIRATKKLRPYTAKYRNAVIKTLEDFGKDCQTPGSYVNKLITK